MGLKESIKMKVEEEVRNVSGCWVLFILQKTRCVRGVGFVLGFVSLAVVLYVGVRFYKGEIDNI